MTQEHFIEFVVHIIAIGAIMGVFVGYMFAFFSER